MVLLVCGRHGPPIWVGGWHDVRFPSRMRNLQRQTRSGHGASGDQNGLEVVFLTFLVEKTWECIYLDSQGVTPLFDTFTLGLCHVLSLFQQGIVDYYCILFYIVA